MPEFKQLGADILKRIACWASVTG